MGEIKRSEKSRDLRDQWILEIALILRYEYDERIDISDSRGAIMNENSISLTKESLSPDSNNETV